VPNAAPITHLAPLATRYDALLCDAWGVIHNGVTLFDGAAEALRRFRSQCGPVIILTNAPRPSHIIPAQLDRLGLPRDAYDGVVTSGDAARAEIARRSPAPAFRLGPEKDDPLYEGIDVAFAPLEAAEFIVCTGLTDDRNETPDHYRPLLARAAARGLPMICANPDIVVRWGGRLVFCAGALAELYEQMGGEVIYGGKPHRAIYDLALAEIGRLKGGPVERRKVLSVGDGVKTDIAGANAQGIDAVFIAGAGGVSGSGGDADEALERAGAHAIAVMEKLQW
jgi:HAD superfamily hydrolase (TIGR01459 family)